MSSDITSEPTAGGPTAGGLEVRAPAPHSRVPWPKAFIVMAHPDDEYAMASILGDEGKPQE